ncbi:MAG: MFS transporter, partial [Acidimicrobiales bacterium]
AQNFGLAASILLGAVLPGFAGFASARFAGSVLSWPQHPIGNSLLVGRFPHRRAFVLSLHTAGGSFGTAVAPIVTGALIAAYGWRVGIGVFAVPIALGGLLVFFFLREGGAGAVVEQGAKAAVRLREVATRRQVVGALAAGTVAAAGRGLGSLTVYVPAYLKSGLHYSPLMVGTVFTVLVIGSIAGPIAAGHIADRFGRALVLAGVYAIGAGAMVVFVLVGHDALFVGAMGLVLGVFAYAESPLLQAFFADGAEGAPTRATFGLFFAISYGVGALWLPLIGWIVDTAGFHVAFYLMGASFLASSLIVLLTAGRSPTNGRRHRGPEGHPATTS